MTSTNVRGVGLGISAEPSRSRLAIPDGTGFNEWREIGETLRRMHDSSQWWIGDWLCYGERYRRDYPAAMQMLDMELAALKNYAWVSSKVSTRVDLSWTHHRLVATLEPDDQVRWLDEALRQSWSTRELEEALPPHRPHSPSAPSFSVRAQSDLYDLCMAEAEKAAVAPTDWAMRGLKWLAENGSPHMRAAIEAAA